MQHIKKILEEMRVEEEIRRLLATASPTPSITPGTEKPESSSIIHGKASLRGEQEVWMEKVIPAKYRQCSFSNFKGGSGLVKWLTDYAEKWPPHSLILSGPCGAGKTHLAISILQEQIQHGHWLDIWFVSSPEMLREIKMTYDPDYPLSEADVIDKYTEIEFLVIDDLGAEAATDWAISTFYLILDRRHRNDTPTLITTNLTTQEIEEKLGARIASRLSEYRTIQLKGIDHRKMTPGQ